MKKLILILLVAINSFNAYSQDQVTQYPFITYIVDSTTVTISGGIPMPPLPIYIGVTNLCSEIDQNTGTPILYATTVSAIDSNFTRLLSLDSVKTTEIYHIDPAIFATTPIGTIIAIYVQDHLKDMFGQDKIAIKP